jgi:hypothetical protein
VANSASDELVLSATAKQKATIQKTQEVIRGRAILRNYTQLKLSARYDYSPQADRFSGSAVAALSHAMFRITDDMDVRLTAGVAVPLSAKGAGRAEPFFRVQENSWSLVADSRGGWRVAYDL